MTNKSKMPLSLIHCTALSPPRTASTSTYISAAFSLQHRQQTPCVHNTAQCQLCKQQLLAVCMVTACLPPLQLSHTRHVRLNPRRLGPLINVIFIKWLLRCILLEQNATIQPRKASG
jgi:hypothetical protein